MTPQLPPLPPRERSHLGLRLTAAAALGRFELQECTRCGAVQYPPREACSRCLCTELEWRLQPGSGTLLSQTALFHSHSEYFRRHLPWRMGTVRLDCGVTVLAHIHATVGAAPGPVAVSLRLDRSGQGVLVAGRAGEVIDMSLDPRLRDLTCDPAGQCVLVTDGASASGKSLVRALIDAGAARVWVGWAGEERGPAPERVAVGGALQRIQLNPSDPESIAAAGGVCGDTVDILINNSSLAALDACGSEGLETEWLPRAQAQMDANYFSLLRLAKEFGPRMATRSTDDRRPAWVNMMSIDAMSNVPSRGTFSASIAAAHSLSQWLRARMYEHGVRVLNVYAAPMDPDALARAVIQALHDGVEEAHAGEVARHWLARWLESPMVLERELASVATRQEGS